MQVTGAVCATRIVSPPGDLAAQAHAATPAATATIVMTQSELHNSGRYPQSPQMVTPYAAQQLQALPPGHPGNYNEPQRMAYLPQQPMPMPQMQHAVNCSSHCAR